MQSACIHIHVRLIMLKKCFIRALMIESGENVRSDNRKFAFIQIERQELDVQLFMLFWQIINVLLANN